MIPRKFKNAPLPEISPYQAPTEANEYAGYERGQILVADDLNLSLLERPLRSEAVLLTGNQTMTGPLALFGDPGRWNEAATKQYVDNRVSGVSGAYLSISGGTMIGPLFLANDPKLPLEAATKQYTDAAVLAGPFLKLTGGNMTGPIILAGDATGNLNPVTLQQLNSAISGLPSFPAQLPPSGPAGGDLTGTYPNPSIKNVNSSVGTYQGITVNAKGQVTAAAVVNYLTSNQTITLLGDVTGSGTTAISAALANTTVTPGVYTNTNLTVDAKGRITAAANGTGGSSVTSGDTPPASPTNGALWFDTANLGLYVYENDGNSSQWVVANASGGGGASVTIADTPPASPNAGALWYDSANTGLYIYENDGTSSQWVVANAQNVWADAASDGRVYGRQNATWVPTASVGALNNAGRNFIHNPCFTVAQRGAGPFTTSGTYTLDRWVLQVNTDTVSVSQLAIADAGRAAIGDETATFILANAFTGNSAAAAGNWLQQRIEGVRRLSGKTVIISFWANATVPLNFGVSIDQIFGQGGSPSAQVNGNGVSVALTTTWTRYFVTLTIPSASGKTFGTTANTDYTQIDFWYSAGSSSAVRSGNVGVQSGQINLWGVQLEVQQPGQVGPTPLDYGGSPQQVLAECQRYYQTISDIGLVAFAAGGSFGGWVPATYSFPVPMRNVPSATPTYTGGSGNPNTAVSVTASQIRVWGQTNAAAIGNYADFSFTLTAEP